MPARTLYELLGVGPDSDAETLHDAFRDAAKAHHPDRNPGDPHATWRFTRIVNAYGILRDADQRGVYDEMLALERERRRAKLTRAIGSNVVAIVALSVVIVGGYTLFAQISKTSLKAAKVVDVAARRPADMTAVEPTIAANGDLPAERRLDVAETGAVPSASVSRTNTGGPPAIAGGGPAVIQAVEPAAPVDASRAEPGGKSTREELADAPPSAAAPDGKSHEPLLMAKDDSAPGPTESNSEVAEAVDALMAAVDRGDLGRSNSGVAKAVDALVAAVDRGDLGRSNGQIVKAVDALVAAVDRGDMGRSNSGVAKAVDALVAAVDRGDMGSVADHQKKTDESHPFDQTRVGSVESRSPRSEKHKPPSSDLAILDEKHDVTTNAKPRAQAKRPATDRTFVRQAAVEGRDMSRAAPESRSMPSCVGACSDRAPPLFGVGF
ncbi:J domain-containing protein [Bradyrhizobium sp.]|uniref:J domain-containing protein n=1 Tax=Bradyrhizobium sp. TaxID=376 RepID=UPI002BF70913|nr:J domain-containing protein [Bradyrhizobium sp.]HWX60145.1 J domain-containing protein [Bradyrhizobium sp.]